MPALTRFFFYAGVVLAISFSQQANAQQTTATPAPAASDTPAPLTGTSLTSPAQGAQKLIADAMTKVNANDNDGALALLNQAIKLSPTSTGAYVIRASIYCQKKQWTDAENDFKSAQKYAPTNVVLKFNLVELKFMQKQYDAARAGFVPLVSDPDMGDFASYKIFLCDLYGGHQDQAKKELDVFNDAMGNPSYYFANAAWDLYYKKVEDARGWLMSASRIYPPQKNDYYAQSLRDLGYLPIPRPKQE